MIKKWDLSPSPVDKNKLRHKLLLDCDMKDIFFIVKKFGGLCSRPEKVTGEYNFLIYISKLEMESMAKLKKTVSGLSGGAASAKVPEKKEDFAPAEPVFELDKMNAPEIKPEPRHEPEENPVINVSGSAAEKPAVPPAPIMGNPIVPPPPSINISKPARNFELEMERIPEPVKPVQAPPLPVKPAVNPAPVPDIKPKAVPAPAAQKQAPAPNAPKTPAQTVSPQPVKQAPVPEHKPVASAHKIVPPQMIPPGVSIRNRAQPVRNEPAAPKEPKEEKKDAVKASAAVHSSDEISRLKMKWPIELPLNPTLSFQTMIAGPHNRFAHAASMAVVENPGVMYNPLLIFGPQGIGKSHLIHSMAYGLSSSIGQKNIFVTDAIKFSIGVDLAIKQNSIASIEKILSDCKVIIIDDINLFMVTDTNKPYISKILNDCVASNKQIIVSSLFPPKSLGPLEDTLNFQFTQGWMVDIKLPNPQTYRLILNQMLVNMDTKLSEDDIKTFFISKMMDFRTVMRLLSQGKKLEKYVSSLDNSIIARDILAMLGGYDDDETYPSESEISEGAAFAPSSEKQWFKWGLFYPKGMVKESSYVLYKLKSFAKEINVELDWNMVFTEEYNPDEILGVPFKIGNSAREKDINGLIILGPQATSALGAKEQEFRHLTEKILESFSIKTAWLDSSKIKAKSNYLKAIMELL